MSNNNEVTEEIDRALGDYSREHTVEDPTGDESLYPVLATAKQVYDCAKVIGFSEAQAMRLARDCFGEFIRVAVAQSQ